MTRVTAERGALTGRTPRLILDLVKPRADSEGQEPFVGATQRVLYFGTPGDDVAVALSDLASVPKLLVEMAVDLEDLEGRLGRRGLNGLPASVVIVAGSRALEVVLEGAIDLWRRHPHLVLIAFHDQLDAPPDVLEDERLVLIDVAADAGERRRTLASTLASIAPSEPPPPTVRTQRVTSRERIDVGGRAAPILSELERGGFIVGPRTTATNGENTRDALTGLADRAALHARLESEIARLRSDPGYQFALLILNINRFKVINDSFGHEQADALLIDVGRRLADAVRQTDLVARIGADEFAIVLGQSQGTLNAHGVAQRLVRSPVTLTSPDGRSLPVTAAVGGVIANQDAPHTVADVLRKASLALSNVKARGGSRVEFFHPEAHARSLFELDLEPQILRGIRDHEFTLHHQPVISLRDDLDGHAGHIVEFEALIRWHHPSLGLVAPGAFIPMLETSGLIEPLGEWIVTRACADLQAFDRGQKRPGVFLNLNVSHRQLRQPEFAQIVVDAIARAGVDPKRLGVELTETTMIDNFEVVTSNIEVMRAAGLRVFVDDFGVGYSSLSSLSRLPVDVLKIDRSFIAEMVKDTRSAALVAKIVEIGHVFDLTVVAEGIETSAELAAVRTIGCDLAQGFHFARPVPLEDARLMLGTRLVDLDG